MRYGIGKYKIKSGAIRYLIEEILPVVGGTQTNMVAITYMQARFVPSASPFSPSVKMGKATKGSIRKDEYV